VKEPRYTRKSIREEEVGRGRGWREKK